MSTTSRRKQLKENNWSARVASGRVTPIRTALLDILAKSLEPKTPQELLSALAKRGFKANKTTVYRQLEALLSYSIIHEVNFADRTNRYELVSVSGHHHHLVCLQCQRIEDVSFPADLEQPEKAILKNHKFKVLRHSLEFFGVCKLCQEK